MLSFITSAAAVTATTVYSAMLPLVLLLLVSGCLSASLPDDSTPTINYPNDKGNVAVDITSKGEVHTNDATTIGDRISASTGAIPLNEEAKQVTAMVEHLVDSSSKHNDRHEETTATPLTMKSQDVGTSSASIMINPENQATTKMIKAMTAQGYETSANSIAADMKPMPTLGYGVSANTSNIATDMKPMPTLGYGVSANSNMATEMKPMPTLGYGLSANSSMATVMKPMPTVGYGVSANSSTTAGVKLTSSQGNGTSMTSSMTTQATKGTTSGNTVTTAAPKKNEGSCTSVSILLSVVPVVISLVLNHQ